MGRLEVMYRKQINKNLKQKFGYWFLRTIAPYKEEPLTLKKQQEFKPVFILSTGRTATKFLAKYLNTHPEVYAVHEPKPTQMLRIWSRARLKGWVTDEEMAPLLQHYRREVFSKRDEKFYIESNPFLWGFASSIGKVFDKAAIIHVVRDPRDYARSALNHGASGGLKGLYNKLFGFGKKSIPAVFNSKRRKLATIAHLGSFWSQVNEFIATLKESDAVDYNLIKFEELIDTNSPALERLIKGLGINPPGLDQTIRKQGAVNQSQLNVAEAWSNWTKKEQQVLMNSVHPLLKQFGYKLKSRDREK